MLTIPTLIVAIAGIGGLLWGMYHGFDKGISGLINEVRGGQDRLYDAGQEKDKEYQAESKANNHQALSEKVCALRNSVNVRQYVDAMVTPEELAKFKKVMDGNPEQRERGQKLYQDLTGQCGIAFTSLLKENDPPITIKGKNSEGEVFFSTYHCSGFLSYLSDNLSKEDIVDPIQKVSLNSEDITFSIGFPDVTKDDFDYIREQIERPRSSAAVAVERTRALSTSSIQSSYSSASFFNRSQLHLGPLLASESESSSLRFSPSSASDSE